jgi:hypothetical protein
MTANIETRFAGKVAQLLIERGVSFSVGHQGDYVTFLIQSPLDIGMRKSLSVYEVLILEPVYALSDESTQ